jgi:hypothetical protein
MSLQAAGDNQPSFPAEQQMQLAQAAQGRRFSALSLMPLVVLPLSLDFKGEEGGGAWQFLITGATLLAAMLYVAANPSIRVRSGLGRFGVLAVLIPVFGGLCSFVVNDVPFERFIRVAAQVWLFALAVLIGIRVAVHGRAEALTRLMFIGCGISVIFAVVAGFLVTGESAAGIRYQIVSHVMLPFEAMLLHKIIVLRRYRWKHMLLLTTCISIQVLSVTRSSILGLLVLLAAALWLSSPKFTGVVRRAVKFAAIGVVLGFVAAQGTALVNPDVGNRWGSRVGLVEQEGVDPTTLSRVAELREQLRLWRSDVPSILFGQGYGAPYGWAEELFDQLVGTGAFGEEGLSTQYFEAGHNFWVSTLFAGGLLFGTTPQILIIWLSVRGLQTSRRRNWAKLPEGQLGSLCTLLIVAFAAISIGGNPMGSRYTSLIIGLATGMFLVLDARRLRLERERQQQLMSQQPPVGPLPHVG